MINYVQQSLEELTLTSTSVTLGYSPGQTVPPGTLVLWPAATATVTLPPINTTLPTTAGGNYTTGAQSLKISIKSLTGQVVNVSSASTTDTFGGAAIVISSSNALATFLSSTTDSKWYLL